VTQKQRQLLGLFGTILFILGLLGYTALYLEAQKIEANRITLPYIALVAIPVRSGQVPEPRLSATAGIAIDYDSGSVLYEKNATTYYSPASTTKLMTALIVRDHFAPEDTLTIGVLPSVSGNVLGLRYGETYHVADLLSAMLITSANDVALEFAAAYPGGNLAFIEKMNEKARALGLQDTIFSNPAGFDFGNHHTTANDLAKIARTAWEDPLIRAAMSTRTASITDTTGRRRHELSSTNQLLHQDESVLGGKTGTTEKAGEVLITLQSRNDHTTLIAILGSSDRYGDTITITNWLYENYTWQEPSPPHVPKEE